MVAIFISLHFSFVMFMKTLFLIFALWCVHCPAGFLISRWERLTFLHSTLFIMAALWNRAGYYIFALWFLSSFFLFFFAKSQRSEIGCLPYFRTWCGLSANL